MVVEELRLGVTLYPSYVEECILGYTHLTEGLGPNCTDPGISVKVWVALQEALKDRFFFRLVNIDDSIGAWNAIVKAFNDGECDLSIDLWTRNVARVQQSEMNILPMTWLIILGFFIAAFVISSVLAVSLMIKRQSYNTEKAEASGCFLYLDYLVASVYKLFQVVVKQPVGLTRFNKSWSATFAWFPWFFAVILFGCTFDAEVTTDLIPTIEPPFQDSVDLADKIEKNQFRLIVEDVSAPLLLLVQTSTSPVYRALNASLTANPVKVFPSDSVIQELKDNPLYVYGANTVAAKFIMGESCDLIEVEDTAAEYSGLNLAFPLNSTLPAKFSETVTLMHSVIHRMIMQVENDRCGDINVEVGPMPVEYPARAFYLVAVGFGIALGVFVLERPWARERESAEAAAKEPPPKASPTKGTFNANPKKAWDEIILH